MNKSMRRALVAIVACSAALVSPVLAQTPPGPPVCGSVASLMNIELFLEATGAKGDNFISIPAVGPLNENPTSGASNGFKQICNRFGLAGSTSAIMQFNAQGGTVTTFTCDQVSAPSWTVGQGALVRPAGVATPITGRIPGIECARPYTSYGEGSGATGDNIYPVPLTITTASPEVLCGQLLLPSGSQVIQFLAGPGNINIHLCGSTATFSLNLGAAVLIRPTGAAGSAVATGTPVIY